MLKYIIIAILLVLTSSASENFTMIFDVTKGKKELGKYEISLENSSKKIVSHSSGVANKVKFFVNKEIEFFKAGDKRVIFVKNQRIDSFEIKTKLSAIDKRIQKEYTRKLKKVKGDDMLLITKTGKKRIELFNKRKVIIKTLDEVLVDIKNNDIDYSKFILFDKSGVMKMIAVLKKEGNIFTIINKTKQKGYIQITTKDGIAQEVKSLVAKWKLKLVKTGSYKTHSIKISKTLQDVMDEMFVEKLSNATVKVLAKIKKTRKTYNFSADLSLELPNEMASKKDYEKAKECKKLLKSAKLKHRKIKIKENSCQTTVVMKLDRKSHNKKIIIELEKKYPQLKDTKKIKFTKSDVNYKLL